MKGCYICLPDDPAADPEGCSNCERRWGWGVDLSIPWWRRPLCALGIHRWTQFDTDYFCGRCERWR